MISCNVADDTKYVEEISALVTADEQSKYLEYIGEMDQKVRTDETEILKQFGYDSKEHKEAWNIINKTDLENLAKIEAFFQLHGHPSLVNHSIAAVGAPWMVIHHQSRNKARFRNFPYLYEAHLKGDLGGGSLAFFLGRMYEFEFGERKTYDKPFTDEIEIQELTTELGLTSIMEEIRTKVDSQ